MDAGTRKSKTFSQLARFPQVLGSDNVLGQAWDSLGQHQSQRKYVYLLIFIFFGTTGTEKVIIINMTKSFPQVRREGKCVKFTR